MKNTCQCLTDRCNAFASGVSFIPAPSLELSNSAEPFNRGEALREVGPFEA